MTLIKNTFIFKTKLNPPQITSIMGLAIIVLNLNASIDYL